MEQFKISFIEEVKDLLKNLTEEVIKLELNPNNEEIIQETFRIMHTIKGSAGMFGFAKIEKLTHHLETLYESIKYKEKFITTAIIDLTLNAIDIIVELLNNAEELSETSIKNYDKILEELVIDELEKTENLENQNIDNQNTNTTIIYKILYNPKEDVLERGIKPFAIFEELDEIGKFKTFPFTDKMPDIDNIDLNKFFLFWEIFFVGKVQHEDIKDIFMFYYHNEYTIEEITISDFFEKDSIFKNFISIIQNKTSIENLRNEIQKCLTNIGIVENKTIENKQIIKINNEKNNQTTYQPIEGIKVSSKKLDDLINLVSELVTLNSGLEIIVKDIKNDQLLRSIKEVSKLSKRFRDNALELRLVPIETLMVKFKRLIRDLSLKLGKSVDFVIEGSKTELDKNIIDKLEAPLMHIIRNSLDHGIELPSERIKFNKPQAGIIRIIAFYSGANVFIQVQDDGCGINPETIRQKAIEKKIITENQQLSEKEIYDIIFLPGFSTSKNLTDVSGRGVGMDIVKKEINNLRGEIDITSEINLGTSVTLKLPLTLSIIDTLFVKIDQWQILIPLSTVVICKQIDKKFDEVRNIEFNNQILSIIDLRKLLNPETATEFISQIVIINTNKRVFGIIVDKILHEHQAVIKPLGHLHAQQKILSGASILGDGSIALVLDVNNLLRKD